MSITPDDIRDRSQIAAQGYVTAPLGSSYTRRLTPDDRGISLQSVLNQVDVYPTETDAVTAMGAATSLLTSEDSLEYLTQVLSQRGGNTAVGNLTAIPLGMIGDDVLGVGFAFDTPDIHFEAQYVYLRVGRVISSLLFMESPLPLSDEYVIAVVQRLAHRIKDELDRRGRSR